MANKGGSDLAWTFAPGRVTDRELGADPACFGSQVLLRIGLPVPLTLCKRYYVLAVHVQVLLHVSWILLLLSGVRPGVRCH